MAEDIHEDLLPSFQRGLRAAGLSPKTVRTHSQALVAFYGWLQSAGIEADESALSRGNIRDYLAAESERVAVNTLRTRYMGLSRFCRWAVEEEILTQHPMKGMPVPVAPAKPVPLITDDELKQLLGACAGKRFYDRRDEAIIRMLLDGGLRNSELCGMTVEGLDLNNEMGMVVGKGGKLRPVYFGARTARAMDRYLRMRKQHRWAHLPNLWLGERGALSGDGVREIVTVRAEKAGLDRTWPHKFRHTWAHEFLMAGGQERDLKRLAGWSSDTMLERYGAAAADLRAREAARRFRRGDRV